MSGSKWNWSPMVVGALAAAAVLLAAGVLMAVYQEQLYSAQQAKSVREQAQILAASVTAAVVFADQKAAQEYVDATRVNPELQAAAVYGGDGHMIAGFTRDTRLPAIEAGGIKPWDGCTHVRDQLADRWWLFGETITRG